jgi:trehalose synthase
VTNTDAVVRSEQDGAVMWMTESVAGRLSMALPSDHMPPFKLITVEDYEPLVGADTVERILQKASRLRDLHVAHVNSTYYGGGVAELLSSLTLLMNSAGIKTGWRVIQGRPDFFSITKKMHNALQGGDINLTDLKLQIYEEVAFENAARNHLDHDVIIVHDPQPLPLIRLYRKKAPWVWRCHIDLSAPHQELWEYLRSFIERYDAVVLSLPEYAQKLDVPQRFIMPAINPFSTANKELSDTEIADRLEHYGIPDDLPLIVQVSRFDKWKERRASLTPFASRANRSTAHLCWLATSRPTTRKARKSLNLCASVGKTVSGSYQCKTQHWSMRCSDAPPSCCRNPSARASD